MRGSYNENNYAGFVPGMFESIEPGYYEEGNFGIRKVCKRLLSTLYIGLIISLTKLILTSHTGRQNRG